MPVEITEGQIFDVEDFETLEPDNGEQELEEEVQKMMNSWDREQMIKEIGDISAWRKQVEEVDFYDGETDFEDFKPAMKQVQEDSVYIEILDPNPEASQICPTDTIIYDYHGYLEYESQPFESTIHDGKPKMSNLESDPIIPGFICGLTAMREGERAKILIHPSAAYGPLGAMPLIPGDAYLLYFVKIHKVYPGSPMDSMISFERETGSDVSVDEKLEMIRKHKDVANVLLRDNSTREALTRYKVAIRYIDLLPQAVQMDTEVRKLLASLLINAVIAYNMLDMHKAATKYAKRALVCDPSSLKAYYQLAKARMSINDLDGALKYVEQGCQMFPETRCFDSIRMALDLKYSGERKKRDEIMKKMSRNFI